MSSNIFDPNAITGVVLADLIKSSFQSITKEATGLATGTWAKLFEDFKPFMKNSYNRIRNVRILCQKERDVDFYEVYIQSNFTIGRKVLTDEDLINRVTEGKNIIVNGNGGAGKTFFMRHLWLTLFASGGSMTPIFVELRQHNLSTSDLPTFIRRTISHRKELSHDLFNFFCRNGRFCFLLDGFDEVDRRQRDDLQKQILEFSAKHINCGFVVSSRYEKRFAGWQNFEIYDSRPFDLPQVRKLVTKVPFDEEAKKYIPKKSRQTFFC